MINDKSRRIIVIFIFEDKGTEINEKWKMKEWKIKSEKEKMKNERVKNEEKKGKM